MHCPLPRRIAERLHVVVVRQVFDPDEQFGAAIESVTAVEIPDGVLAGRRDWRRERREVAIDAMAHVVAAEIDRRATIRPAEVPGGRLPRPAECPLAGGK